MRSKPFILFLLVFCFLSFKNTISQVVDTLYYYPPYDTLNPNFCMFIAMCGEPEWCEPIAVWFTPDSSVSDTTYNVYSIRKIRFCFTGPYMNTSFSIHFGDSFPVYNTNIFEHFFSVDSGEYNPNYYMNSIPVFKEIDLSQISILQNINLNEHFWVRLNEKVFSLYNTYLDTTPPIPSGHSFADGAPGYTWDQWDCDWHLQAIVEYENVTDIYSNKKGQPKVILGELYQNYPNPMNSNETVIKYRIARNSHVQLSVYNILGEELIELVNMNRNEGIYEVPLNLSILSSGPYLYILRVNNQLVSSKRMIIIK